MQTCTTKLTSGSRCVLQAIIALVSSAAVGSIASAQQVDWWPMSPGTHPIVDGLASPPPGEWSASNYSLNLQGDGTFRAQWQRDWIAKSSTSSTNLYPGVTLFDMHDLWGYRTSELADYNTFEYTLGTTSVRGWVFANGDELDDSTWISQSELGYTSVDDRGFIVRLNNNPATDFHWLPGMPEPGDLLWNWNDTYGFFGAGGFNNSTFVENLPINGGGTLGEVYETALYGGAQVWLDATGGGGGGGGGGFTPCSTTIKRIIKDPKRGAPAQVLEIKIDGPGHVDVPGPGSALVAVLGVAAAVCGRRRDRQSSQGDESPTR